jgi:hypothetical protein
MKYHTDFNQTKYTRWYYAIIQKRAITDKRLRHEVHHILPQSLGGGDEPENLVRLSGHDHAWCHWLLTKMTSGEDKSKMVYAFNMMGVYGEHMERQSSYAIVRAYERNRLEWSKTHGKVMREQFENGRVIWNKGRKEDRPEVLENVKRAAQNRDPLSPEKLEVKVAKSVATMKKNGTNKRSVETRAKMKTSQTGIPKPKSKEFREQVSKTLTGKPKPKGHGDAVAAANRGITSINKDGVEKKVKKDVLQSWLDNGWSLGGRLRVKKQTS